MRVLVLYNLAKILKRGRQEDLSCEEEITIIVPLVVDNLRRRGYTVESLETSFNLWNKLVRRRKTFDIVFNLAEGFGGTNSQEIFVIALLEALEIPFTGASLHNFVLTHEKGKANQILSAYGVPTPRHQVFYPGQDIALKGDLRFPLIVKPMYGDASLGITYESVVADPGALIRRVKRISALYKQPVLAEEFIEGREISVGCIGNRTNLELFPPLEFVFDRKTPPHHRFRSYEYKWGGEKEGMVRADLPRELVDRFLEYTRIAFLVMDCLDYARMDFRLSRAGEIFLLETNCNPGIGPNTHGLNNTLTMMAGFTGYSFEDLTERILLIAKERYGL